MKSLVVQASTISVPKGGRGKALVGAAGPSTDNHSRFGGSIPPARLTRDQQAPLRIGGRAFTCHAFSIVL